MHIQCQVLNGYINYNFTTLKKNSIHKLGPQQSLLRYLQQQNAVNLGR